MGKWLWLTLLSGLAFGALKFNPIATYSPYEVEPGHLFHANVLWEAHNVGSAEMLHAVDVFTSDGKHLATKRLRHSVSQIYPWDSTSVLITGKHYNQYWETGYSIVRKTAHGLETVTTRFFPVQIVTQLYTGNRTRMFFNEPGNRKIFEATASGYRFLQPEVSNPGAMVLHGNYLYAIERHEFRPGDEGLVRIDLKTEKIERTFGNFVYNNITNILKLENTSLLALPVTWGDQILLVDADTNKLVRTLNAPGGPRGITQLGHCIVTYLLFTNQLSFYDLNSQNGTPLLTWNVPAPTEYKNIRELTVDVPAQRFFLRSVYASDELEGKVGVFSVEDTTPGALNTCLAVH